MTSPCYDLTGTTGLCDGKDAEKDQAGISQMLNIKGETCPTSELWQTSDWKNERLGQLYVRSISLKMTYDPIHKEVEVIF